MFQRIYLKFSLFFLSIIPCRLGRLDQTTTLFKNNPIGYLAGLTDTTYHSEHSATMKINQHQPNNLGS